MKIQSRLMLTCLPLAILLTGPVTARSDCLGYSAATKSQPLAVEITPGVHADVFAEYVDRTADRSNEARGDEPPSCFVTVDVRLSSFPSSRLATRPGDIAPAIRDVAREWGAKECVITIWYENDTNEEMADHERCVTGTFGFAGRASWSTSSEENCWEPTSDELTI